VACLDISVRCTYKLHAVHQFYQYYATLWLASRFSTIPFFHFSIFPFFHHSIIPLFHHCQTNDQKVQRTGMFVANKPAPFFKSCIAAKHHYHR